MKKKLSIYLLVLVVLFLLPALILGFTPAYVKMVGIVVVVALVILVFGAFYTIQQSKAEAQRLKIMTEQHDLKRYLELQRMAALKAKTREMKSAGYLNLAAGYINNDQLDDAVYILNGLTPSAMNQACLVVYYYNLLFAQVMRGDRNALDEAYAQAQGCFYSAAGNPRFSGMIATIEVMVALGKGQYEKAEALLEKLPGEPATQDEKNLLGWMKAEIYLHTKRKDSARKLLRKIQEGRPYPLMNRAARQALKECDYV